MTAWEVYWLMQADKISDAAIGVAVASGVSFGVVGFLALLFSTGPTEDITDVGKKLLPPLKWLAATFVVFLPLSVFMPSTKTLAAMYAVPLVVNNEQLQSDLTDVYTLGMERLKEVLEVEKSK